MHLICNINDIYAFAANILTAIDHHHIQLARTNEIFLCELIQQLSLNLRLYRAYMKLLKTICQSCIRTICQKFRPYKTVFFLNNWIT